MTGIVYPFTDLSTTQRFIIDHAEGAYVWDDAGNRYLEGLSGLWCTALGFGNQELIETAAEAMSRLSYTHMFGGRSHQPGIELSEKLVDMVPVSDAKVFFGSSGSDANDTHIKILRYMAQVTGRPEKRKIITRERAYHGSTVAAGSLTSLPANLKHFDAPLQSLGIIRTDAPCYYSGALEGETEPEFVDRIVANLEQLILDEGPETIAAMLCEPVTGASGVIVPPQGYYQKVQAVLDKYEVLFWADEVISGFGRTGTVFGVESQRIESPDLMTLGKQLSSGYFPISASVIHGDIYEALVEPSSKVGLFGHGFTFSGHPVGCAVAAKALEIYERDDVYGHAARVGKYLQNRLREFTGHEIVGDVRGIGMIGAVEIVADKATRKHFEPAVINHLQNACRENGLIGRALMGNTFAVCPPLVVTRDQIDELIEALGKGLDATAASFRGNKGFAGVSCP